MNRLDELIIKNSKGLLSNSDRWNLNSAIENSVDSNNVCDACNKLYPNTPSRSVIESDYCKGHLRYVFAMAINPYNFF